MDYINVNKFINFADYKLFPSMGFTFNAKFLEKSGTIFCKIEYIGELFNNLRFSNNLYIVIVGSSDYPLTKHIFHAKPNCVKKIYAQNADYNHPDLIPIPIGLGPDEGSIAWRAHPVTKQQITHWYIEHLKELQDEKKDLHKVYCNWNSHNNSSQRVGILNTLKSKNINFVWGRGGDELNKDYVPPYTYYKDMSKSKFVISPPGNGLDCHRTWEALYMGCFPVVIRHNIYKEYDDLPIIKVNNYAELSYDLLHSYLNKEYNYEKLKMSYWKNRIKKDLYE